MHSVTAAKRTSKNTIPKFPIFYDDYCETSFAEVDGV